MPCTKCSCEFGILKREVGCGKCGFGFCPKCCKKHEVQEGGTTVMKHLCSDCLTALTENIPVANISPPLAHKKRMAAFRKSYSVDSTSSSFSHEKDRELFERLKKLKKDDAASPSEREIEERLAKLKGMDPSKYKAPPIEVYRPPDKRTSIEKASDFLMQISEEVRLDSKRVKPEDEIANRLAALRGEAVKESNIPVESLPDISPSNADENVSVDDTLSDFQKLSKELSSEVCKEIKELNITPEHKELISSIKQEKETGDSDEDNEEADKLVAQLLASSIPEDDLESNSEPSAEKSGASSKKESLDEEFPWCVICTNNAQIRCFDCDQDLYCLRCFRECHDSFEIRGHKTCPYTPPATPIL